METSEGLTLSLKVDLNRGCFTKTCEVKIIIYIDQKWSVVVVFVWFNLIPTHLEQLFPLASVEGRHGGGLGERIRAQGSNSSTGLSACDIHAIMASAGVIFSVNC